APYAAFLNAKDPSGANVLGLYPGGPQIVLDSRAPLGQRYSAFTYPNRPLIGATWYDAVRFANWLNNGQGSASTESGAYTLVGGTPTPSNSDDITRNSGARVFIPSQDEWYKAAYYNPNTKSYFLYPTASDTPPTATTLTSAPNSAN